MIADEHVLGLHPLGFGPNQVHAVPRGEAAKTPSVLVQLWADLDLDRSGAIVGYGGGSTTDVAGLAAATYLRGVRWVAVPTTLLGQVDAAIGGKTAVDLAAGKNLVGAFHYPAGVVVDPDVLDTLSETQRREGMAEVVKTGLLAGRPLWELGEDELVRGAAAFKAGVCLGDPFDRGRRAILNLGHTFAHALEAAAGYDGLSHGSAVALGLLAALRLSGRSTDVVEEVLGTEPVQVDRDRAWAALRRDKKSERGRLRLVLLDEDGPWSGLARGRDSRGAERVDRGLECADAGRRPERGQPRRPRTSRSRAVRRSLPLRAGDANLRVGVGARLRRAVPTDEPRGGVRRVVPRRVDRADGIIANPGAWTHYSYAIRDALELFKAPIVEVHLSNIEEREEWRGKSVIADVAAKRVLGKGPDGYREALEFIVENGATREPANRAATRVAGRAAARHEPHEHQLSLRVQELERRAPRRARARAALHRLSLLGGGAGRRGCRVRGDETRTLLKDLAGRSSGPIGFEADFVSYSGYETLRGGAIEPVPRRGLVERLRAVKDDDELASIRRACEITDRMFERLIAEPFVGRTERDVAWTIEQLFHDEGADAVAFETIVAAGPNSARPHGRATDRPIGRGETIIVDTGCVVGGYVSDYTRTFASGFVEAPVKQAYAVVLAAQQAGFDALRSGVKGSMPMRPRDESSTRRLRRNVRARARPWPRPRGPRGSAPVDGVDRHAGRGQRGHGRARYLPRGSRRHPDRGQRRDPEGGIENSPASARTCSTVG